MSKSESKPTLYCSFCGNSQWKVRKLIAGPEVFICNECIELCMDIIVNTETEAGTSYSKFLAYFKKPKNSLEKFNSFLSAKTPEDKIKSLGE